MSSEAVSTWGRLFTPMSEVKVTDPKWVLPGLLVPGLNLLVGPPKTFKSLLVLHMTASILEGQYIGDPKAKRVTVKPGPVVYFAAEQSPSALKHIYEKRVIGREMKAKGKSWDFVIPKDAWSWQIDNATPDYNLEAFIEDWKPAILVLDPLVYFHSIDENDPQLVRPLVPLRKAMLRHGGALVVVHHSRKEQQQQTGRAGMAAPTADWNKVRGTGALWGMADAGIMMAKLANGAVAVSGEFKDFPANTWTWRPK